MSDIDAARILIPPENVEQGIRDFTSDFNIQDVQIFHAVRFLAQRMNDHVSTWLAPYGLSAAKFNYLAVLHARRQFEVSSNDLIAFVHTTSASVSAMVDALERDGLLVRKPHSRDKRSTLLKLTPKGKRLYVNAATAQHDHLAEALAPLSDDDRSQLLSLLVRTGNALYGVELEAERVSR